MTSKIRGSLLLRGSACLLLAGWVVAGCVGVTPVVPFDPIATATLTSTQTPTPRPTDTPLPSPTPVASSTPTPTVTLAPTPTRDPSLPRFPTPEFGESTYVRPGGFSFRNLIGYEIRVRENQVTIFNEETDFAVSLSGFTAREYGSLERVILGLLDNISKSFTTFTAEPIFPNPVDGHDGVAAIVHGELKGENVSGLVVVLAPDDTQLFYAIAMIPDTPEGSVWQVDGWPVMDAVLSSLEFFPPTGE